MRIKSANASRVQWKARKQGSKEVSWEPTEDSWIPKTAGGALLGIAAGVGTAVAPDYIGGGATLLAGGAITAITGAAGAVSVGHDDGFLAVGSQVATPLLVAGLARSLGGRTAGIVVGGIVGGITGAMSGFIAHENRPLRAIARQE